MESNEYKFASALLSIAIEKKCVGNYLNEVENLLSILEKNKDILKFFKSSFVEEEKKREIIDSFKTILSKDIISFLHIINDYHLSYSLLKILKKFILLAQTHLNIAAGQVYSSEKLTNNELQKIIINLQKKLNKEIKLVNQIDPSLIGGIKVVIDNQIFDYSLKNQLYIMEQNLKRRN